MPRPAALVVAAYLIASASFELLAAHVDSMGRVVDTVRYAEEKDAYAPFYLLNGLSLVAGAGLLLQSRWARLLTYLLLLGSTYHSARAVAWSIEGLDDEPFFPFVLALFGVWNLFWAALLFFGRRRS
jgi:hypothetical protein